MREDIKEAKNQHQRVGTRGLKGKKEGDEIEGDLDDRAGSGSGWRDN